METQELQDVASRMLVDMTKMMGFEITCSVQNGEAEGDFKLVVACEMPSRLIGRRGQTLDALELLLNRMLRRQSEELPWIHLDIDGYLSNESHDGHHGKGGSHEDELWKRFSALAADAAKEVKYWKKAKRLGPYNPAERRVIHTVIKDIEGVCSESEPAPLFGERMKYVHICLENEGPENASGGES